MVLLLLSMVATMTMVYQKHECPVLYQQSPTKKSICDKCTFLKQDLMKQKRKHDEMTQS